MIHRVKGFGIVKKLEIDVFLELSCFFHDPVDVGKIYICIVKLCGIHIDLICPDKNVVNYNSNYHISVTYHSSGQATLSIAI